MGTADDYNLEKFFIERDDLISNQQQEPSKEFIDKFMERVNEGLKIIEEEDNECCGDSDDYRAWNYALNDDIYEQDEDLVDDLNLFDWVEYYEGKGDKPS